MARYRASRNPRISPARLKAPAPLATIARTYGLCRHRRGASPPRRAEGRVCLAPRRLGGGRRRAAGAGGAGERRRAETLGGEAAAAVSDPQCREEMGIVGDYAAELFGRGEHRKWESESMSGAEFLRLQILKALDSFHSRLYSIEAIRRPGERQPYPAAPRSPRGLT